MTKLALIAGIARNGTIGKDNALLWRLPADLQRFKRLTLGSPVIMGRKTWESLPAAFRPLPGRRNLVLTRDAAWHAAGAERVASLADAIERVRLGPPAPERVFVIGGAELYALALPLADELLLTEIDADFDGDTCFPPWDRADWVETARESHRSDAGWAYHFVDYARRGARAAGGGTRRY